MVIAIFDFGVIYDSVQEEYFCVYAKCVLVARGKHVKIDTLLVTLSGIYLFNSSALLFQPLVRLAFSKELNLNLVSSSRITRLL